MIRAALLVLLMAGAAMAAPDHGLMWNRSGLPATLPLQIRTDPGRDHYITLRDAATGDPALAAYIEGGRFFRVLVPPGTFVLDVASGTDWLDEDRLFGPRTETMTFDEALTFGVTGIGTKRGHLIDLRGVSVMAEAEMRDIGLCQWIARDIAPRPQLADRTPDKETLEERLEDRTAREQLVPDPDADTRIWKRGGIPATRAMRLEERFCG
ncbi:hypothetical protein OCGS_0278 [Oceaniovalibus guishaninsula JLT2003]|uniref:Uncharacterized protein n=1 Tax=Oceaniovalibus guishaninsula JLT2003 TaxID=1231392 RepID=K2GT14_9RHOB|nr:hypothetical protein [Oceaniovalibus guishaninsula]EKE45661.1 hypothetical protein OCGS_0278 [Oceaniovalibus guishaninsula JLT2003]